jgi:para-aminobenzoate synthetase component 1
VEKSIYCVVHLPIAANQMLEWQYNQARQRAMEMERQWKSWLSIAQDQEAVLRHRNMQATMEKDSLHIDVESLPGLSTSMSKQFYQDAVRRIQQYIGQGDVFQVNLSLRQSRPTHVSSETLYEWLRMVNPSPYMGMLRTPSFALVSASPELLVKLDGGQLTTRPIAGTRRRGISPEEDRAMEDELLSNEKERAEHVMMVDLERNDLGRVAEYGTVKVPELMTVERYSHVMHLVSQVEGKLAPGKDALDVLAAVFPGGTITGAPKIRTMEIIEELEPTRRGPYTGSMGWIDYSGNMEFNIIIRTIAVMDGICHIQAGAGIVIDSNPEREFYESLSKAKALWKAVQYGERQEEPL